MAAKWTGALTSESIFEALLELKKIPFLNYQPSRSTLVLAAHDTMATNVRCVNETEILDVIMTLLRSTTHNAFPVVRDGIGKQVSVHNDNHNIRQYIYDM